MGFAILTTKYTEVVSVSDDQIMVVRNTYLFNGGDRFEGFLSSGQEDYEARILKFYEYMGRDLAEENPDYKQPIGYAIIVNPSLRQVFVYHRSKQDEEYPEKRLQGKHSCGVGGHIRKIDNSTENPIYVSMLRELEEEVDIHGSVNLRAIGCVNSEKDEVSSVHFAVLYAAITDAVIVEPKDPEIANGALISVEIFQEICQSPGYAVEEWSRIALGPLTQLCTKQPS